MQDLISRKAAIAALGDEPEVYSGKDEYEQGLNNQWHYDRNALIKLPSAQPEIVRCKDCKFYEIYELKADYTDDKRYKPSVCVKRKFAVKRSEDWFCADAEPKEKEGGDDDTR